MNPPKLFKPRTKQGWSLCMACERWRHNAIFHHEGQHWILCDEDYADYWFNTDVLLADYKGY